LLFVSTVKVTVPAPLSEVLTAAAKERETKVGGSELVGS
jgi:hypothetical protein